MADKQWKEHILSITNPEGVKFDDKSSIMEEIKKFYRDLFLADKVGEKN